MTITQLQDRAKLQCYKQGIQQITTTVWNKQKKKSNYTAMNNKQQAIERNHNEYATTYPGPSELTTQGKAEPKKKQKQEKNKKQMYVLTRH